MQHLRHRPGGVFRHACSPGTRSPGPCRLCPERAAGSPCAISPQLTLGSHTGTHMDAPSHFVPGGRTIDQLDLGKCVGPCLVAEAAGPLSPQWVEAALAGGVTRLLIKGDIEVTPQAAEKMAELGLGFLGVEHFTVGTEETGVQVHRILLGAEIALLEACTLEECPGRGIPAGVPAPEVRRPGRRPGPPPAAGGLKKNRTGKGGERWLSPFKRGRAE